MAAPTTCLSSKMMSELLAWRNPQGSEEGWWYSAQPEYVEDACTHLGKIGAAEVGIVLLTAIALVETVAYAALALIALACSPLIGRSDFFRGLLESSSFTIVWGLADALFYNPLFINVLTQEFFARYWADLFNPTPLTLFRQEDRIVTASWYSRRNWNPAQANAMLAPIMREGQAMHERIEAGAAFIKDHVLKGVSESTMTSFKEDDPAFYEFLAIRAVYLYAAGSKRTEKPIPNFFQNRSEHTTRDDIQQLREKYPEGITSDELTLAMSGVEHLHKRPQEKVAQEAYDKLRSSGGNEMRGGILVTQCFTRAKELLTPQVAAQPAAVQGAV